MSTIPESWVADYAHWRDLPLDQKVVAVEESILACGSDRSAIYAAFKTVTRYPFGHDLALESSGRDICVKGGRINLPTGRLVDWRIWRSEHVVEIDVW